MTKRRRSHRKSSPQGESEPIDGYKVTDDSALDEELDALDYEPPVFSLPELDRVLGNTKKEAAQMMTIYKL